MLTIGSGFQTMCTITKAALCLWDPYLQKDIDVVESVQKFAVRVCSRTVHGMLVTQARLCSSVNIPTLAARRKMKVIVRNCTWSC